MGAVYQLLQVRKNVLVSYLYYDGFRRKKIGQDYFKFDLSEVSNKTKGKLSQGAIRRLRYAVNLLEESSPYIMVTHPTERYRYKFKLGFLTLTLPASQGELTDNYIKDKCLNVFLTSIQKKFGKFSYVWKAEAQKNGNIHFHITWNKWILHSYIRYYWNLTLRRAGLIAEYKREQEEFHKDGFRLRSDMIEYWPEEAQRKAYEFGKFTNWQEPNTIDIHSIKNINNLAAYLIKYMSKNEEGRREIQGKIWGCSKNLNYSNKFVFVNEGLTAPHRINFEDDNLPIADIEGRVLIYRREPHTLKFYFPKRIADEYQKFLSDTYHFQ